MSKPSSSPSGTKARLECLFQRFERAFASLPQGVRSFCQFVGSWIALICGFQLLRATWPVNLWVAAATLALLAFRAQNTTWSRVAAKMIEPLVWALVLLVVLEGFYNFSTPDARSIAATEQAIVWLSLHAPKWMQPEWWQAALILVALTFASLLLPKARLISRFAGITKATSRVMAIVTMLTAFSFFSRDIFAPRVTQVYTRVFVTLKELKEKEPSEQARLLCLEAFQKSLTDLSAAERDALHSSLSATHAMAESARCARLAGRALAESHYPPPKTVAAWQRMPTDPSIDERALVLDDVPSQPAAAAAETTAPKTELKSAPLQATGSADPAPPSIELDFHRLEAAEAQAKTVAATTEAEKGVNQTFEKLLGHLSDSLKELLGGYIGAVLDVENDVILRQVREYVLNVTGDAVEAAAEKLVATTSQKLRRVIGQNLANKPPKEAACEVVLRLKRTYSGAASLVSKEVTDGLAAAQKLPADQKSAQILKLEARANQAVELADVANSFAPEVLAGPGGGVTVEAAASAATKAA